MKVVLCYVGFTLNCSCLSVLVLIFCLYLCFLTVFFSLLYIFLAVVVLLLINIYSEAARICVLLFLTLTLNAFLSQTLWTNTLRFCTVIIYLNKIAWSVHTGKSIMHNSIFRTSITLKATKLLCNYRMYITLAFSWWMIYDWTTSNYI